MIERLIQRQGWLIFCVVAWTGGVASLAAQSLRITHFAGTTGGGAYVDGQGTNARFSLPSGVGVDSSGNVYVADSGNDLIRKISPSGSVSTLAGSPGKCGGVDGTGSAARFCFPQGVVPDDAGNLFVADGQEIREITPDGTVTTFAGTPGLQGTADGTGAAARFYFPTGIVRDAAGNLYVTDGYSDFIPGGSVGFSTIRKVTPQGVVTTIAGSPTQRGFRDGVGANALFDFGGGGGIAVDALGNLYVADTFNAVIRLVNPAGVVSTIAGSPRLFGSDDGNGSNARFGQPHGLVLLSDGTLFVADSGGYTIRKISPNRDVTTFAGGPNARGFVDGAAAAARFNNLSRLASDGSNLFVADNGNNAIRKVVIATAAVSTLAGGSPVETGTNDGIGAAARFFGIHGIATDGPNLYVADSFNSTIRRVVVATAEVTTFAGANQSGTTDGVGGAARFNYPGGLATDGTNLYVADVLNSTIRRIALANAAVSTLAGVPGGRGFADGAAGTAQFNLSVIDVSGLATDGSNLYVADTRNSVIRRVDLNTGQVSTVAGTPGVTGSADGVGANALFSSPADVLLDGGNLYVSDSQNLDIRKIVLATGEVTTFAGAAGQNGTADGVGTAARFAHPEGLAINGTDLYVADDFGPTIRKIDLATQSVTTVAGTPGYNGAMDGTGSGALLANPLGLAFTNNSLFIADQTLNDVRAGVCGADDPVSPTVTPVGNPTGPVTGTDFLNLQWSPTAAGPSTSYDWAINGDSFTSTVELSATAPPRSSNDPITLHVRGHACNPEVTGSAADSATYSPAPPVASFSMSGSGTTFTFTDTSTPQATSWLWLFGDRGFATTQSTTHTYSTAQVFTVVLIATNGAGSSETSHPTAQSIGIAPQQIHSTAVFDTLDPQRQRLAGVRLAGSGDVRLHVVSSEAEETIVYLRLLDDSDKLGKERRLSIAPGQEAVYDVGAYGLRGTWTLELVSGRKFEAFVEERQSSAGPRKRDGEDR